MAQSVIGNLRVILGLDSAQLMRGAKQAEGRIQKLGSQMRKFGIAIGAVSGGVALAMRGALNAADDAGKLAAKVGLSVEALTRLQFAADLSGVATQSLQAGITRLSRAMVDGNEAFAATGIAARDAAGNIRPTEDVLLDLADVFQRMPDGAEKTALAVQLLGRSGADLIPLLNGGSEALRGMMAEADALGLTISKETFKAAEVFNDSLTRIGAVARGFTLQVMAQLAPALAGMAAALADSAKEGGQQPRAAFDLRRSRGDGARGALCGGTRGRTPRNAEVLLVPRRASRSSDPHGLRGARRWRGGTGLPGWAAYDLAGRCRRDP